jgi:hypothetical protein
MRARAKSATAAPARRAVTTPGPRPTAQHPLGSTMAHLSSLHGAIGNRRVTRLLDTDMVRAQLTPENPVLQKQPDDKPEQGDPKGSAWSRKLTEGPRSLDDNDASYKVFFDHVLPPVPKGAKQVWQVVKVHREILNDKCKKDEKDLFIVDIVGIGDRTTMNDEWSYFRSGNPCFASVVNKAEIGFDDRKSNYKQQTNKEVSPRVAEEVLRKMKGPKGSYAGTYTFVREGTWCKRCEKEMAELKKKHAAPAREALSIDGVGNFTSEK